MTDTSREHVHRGLQQLLSAGRPLIAVRTFEEDRLSHLLQTAADHHELPFWSWSVGLGLSQDGEMIPGTESAIEVLRYLLQQKQPALVWLKDLHQHYEPAVIRALRDLYYRWRDLGGYVILSSPTRQIPEDLEREIAYLVLEMPSRGELLRVIESQTEDLTLTEEISPAVIAASLKGLTLAETRHALTRLKRQKPDPAELMAMLQEEKRQLIAKSGTLEYIPRVPAIDELGGLENLKSWLEERRTLMLNEDPAMQEIIPKGLLLMGVSGCGKSLCVKAISSGWRLPLYRIEMTRVFSGAYGSPELAFVDACRLMEDMAPAVLWIDEIEMGLSAEGSAAADSVLSRIFAFFLTWMQEKPAGLFVAATANRIDLLPAEMIRKGRFDQVFFVDLPTPRERQAIFKIHLSKRGYDPEAFTPDVFADATDGWNGAEIEQFVIAAITSAKMEHRDLGLKDLYAARKQIVPISTTMEEQVRHIRNWAYERAVRASAES